MAPIDRISNLPDHLLQHALSLLNSRQAVQTCVLSKRWKNLWVGIHSLELVQPDFRTRSPNKERSFEQFVNMLLSKRNPFDLHMFRLSCNLYHICSKLITAWILYAVRHNAVAIKIVTYRYRKLPGEIFNSASLEELYLAISDLDRGIAAGGVNLPGLKKLHLYKVVSHKRAILRELLSGCPALEDLSLTQCDFDICVIYSPQLKYLKISSKLGTARIKSIRAPNLILLDLVLCGDVLCATNFEEMPFLLNASISVDGGTGFDAKCRILSAFPNVRNLELSGSVMKDLLSVELPKCPTFLNLTKLQLYDLCRTCHGDLVDGMLEHSPNLEKPQLYTWCHLHEDDR